MQVAAIEHKLRGSLPLDATKAADADGASSAGAGAGAEAGTNGSGSGVSAAEQVAASWSVIKAQLSAVTAAVEGVLAVSDALRREAELQAAAAALGPALAADSGSGGGGGAGGEGEGEGGEAGKGVSGLLQGWEGRRLLQLVLALPPPQRKQLVDSQQRVSAFAGAGGALGLRMGVVVGSGAERVQLIDVQQR